MNSEANVTMTLEEEQKQNRQLGRQINREARSDPNSPYAGKYVGILRGQVVVAADTLNEVVETLERLEPDPRHYYFIEASADYDSTHYIWRADLCPE
jgi:hypothetical protein